MRSPDNDKASGSPGSRLPILVIGAIGVVYGDIGTSPLYTMREAFGLGGLPLGEATVLGVLSLIFWALLVVVTLKYVAVIMRADNQGQGGVLALVRLPCVVCALVDDGSSWPSSSRWWALRCSTATAS